MKVEVAVLGSPSLTVRMVCGRKATLGEVLAFRAQELCERRDERPGLPVPNSPYGLCGRRAPLKSESQLVTVWR